MADELGSHTDKLKSAFQELLDDLQNDDVTHNNAETFYKRVIQNNSLAEGHISNSEILKEQHRDRYAKMREKKAIQEMLQEQQVAPVELLNYVINSYRCLDEIRAWERLKNEVMVILLKKLFNAFMAMKSFEIQNAVNEGFEVRQQEWMNLVKELNQTNLTNVMGKYESMKDRMVALEKYFNDMERRIMRIEMVGDRDNKDKYLNSSTSFNPVTNNQSQKSIERDNRQKVNEFTEEEIQQKVSKLPPNPNTMPKPKRQQTDEEYINSIPEQKPKKRDDEEFIVHDPYGLEQL